MYEALVEDRDQWLKPWDHERTPELVEAVSGERVVLAPWVDDDVDRVEILITTEGGRGAQLTVVLHAEQGIPPHRHRVVRYRLGTLFGEAPRAFVDGF